MELMRYHGQNQEKQDLNFSLFPAITDSSPKARKLWEQSKTAEELVYKTIREQIWSILVEEIFSQKR